MKSLFLYRLFVVFTYPFVFFLSDEKKTMFYLRYLIDKPYFFAYAISQARFESGNFTNTYSVQYNNPFSMGYTTNSPVFVSDVGNTVSANNPNFAKYPCLAEACYDYVHRNLIRFPQGMTVLVNNAPNVYHNNEFGVLDMTVAPNYFAHASMFMDSSNYFVGTTYSTYQQGVWWSFMALNGGIGNYDTKYKYYKYQVILMLLTYPIVIGAIWVFFSKSGKKFRMELKN